MRIGILTGGGDVPGLNSAIKSAVYRATDFGHEVLGIRRGWRGLTHVRPGHEDDGEYVQPLDRSNTRAIDRSGGTMLHTSRTNPARMSEAALPADLPPERVAAWRNPDGTYDLTPRVLENVDRLSLDVLLVIGGDDTLSFASVLDRAGVPVVAVPKTMDNDVPATEYCIGFSSAVSRAQELIDRQRTTLGSHERIGIFRIFGRDCGFSALATAYVTSGRCLIPEAPFDLDQLVRLMVEDRAANASGYAFVIAAEGAIWEGGAVQELGPPDAFGHRHKANVAEALAREIRERTGIETLASELTYDLRSGKPDALDQMVAMTVANVALDLVAAGRFGRMVAVRGGRYDEVPLPGPDDRPRRVDVPRLYDLARLRPTYEGKLGHPLLLGDVIAD